MRTLAIIQAPHVTRDGAARCDEPFISISQAQHLKSLGGKRVVFWPLFHRGGAVRALCAHRRRRAGYRDVGAGW